MKKQFEQKWSEIQFLPLYIDDKALYFLTESYQLWGYDLNKKGFMEPTGTTKHHVINSAIDIYFNDEEKNKFKEKFNFEFDDLVERKIRYSYIDRFLGNKYFEVDGKLYMWTIFGRKWEIIKNNLSALFE